MAIYCQWKEDFPKDVFTGLKPLPPCPSVPSSSPTALLYCDGYTKPHIHIGMKLDFEIQDMTSEGIVTNVRRVHSKIYEWKAAPDSTVEIEVLQLFEDGTFGEHFQWGMIRTDMREIPKGKKGVMRSITERKPMETMALFNKLKQLKCGLEGYDAEPKVEKGSSYGQGQLNSSLC